jgi:hypothetical protein
MRCCRTCKHRKISYYGEWWEYACLKTSTETLEFDRISGNIKNKKYTYCECSVDLCDKEGYYEPNLIQKFKDFFTGE